MSWELMEEVLRHSRTTGAGRQAMVAMARFANQDRHLAYPQNEIVIEKFGVSERTLQRGLRECEELGELQRQPLLEDYQRRRVYLVDPTFRRQAALPGLAELGVSPGVSRQTPAPAPVSSRAGVREETEETLKLPPNPPTGGVALTSPSPFTSPPTDNRDTERAARRGRRSRSRRSRSSASDVCPLSALDAERLAMLTEETRAIVEALNGRWDEGTKHERSWRLRSRGAHLHALDPLTLAFPPVDHSWVSREFPIALEKVCGRPVQLVICEGVNA